MKAALRRARVLLRRKFSKVNGDSQSLLDIPFVEVRSVPLEYFRLVSSANSYFATTEEKRFVSVEAMAPGVAEFANWLLPMTYVAAEIFDPESDNRASTKGKKKKKGKKKGEGGTGSNASSRAGSCDPADTGAVTQDENRTRADVKLPVVFASRSQRPQVEKAYSNVLEALFGAMCIGVVDVKTTVVAVHKRLLAYLISALCVSVAVHEAEILEEDVNERLPVSQQCQTLHNIWRTRSDRASFDESTRRIVTSAYVREKHEEAIGDCVFWLRVLRGATDASVMEVLRAVIGPGEAGPGSESAKPMQAENKVLERRNLQALWKLLEEKQTPAPVLSAFPARHGGDANRNDIFPRTEAAAASPPPESSGSEEGDESAEGDESDDGALPLIVIGRPGKGKGKKPAAPSSRAYLPPSRQSHVPKPRSAAPIDLEFPSCPPSESAIQFLRKLCLEFMDLSSSERKGSRSSIPQQHEDTVAYQHDALRSFFEHEQSRMQDPSEQRRESTVDLADGEAICLLCSKRCGDGHEESKMHKNRFGYYFDYRQTVLHALRERGLL